MLLIKSLSYFVLSLAFFAGWFPIPGVFSLLLRFVQALARYGCKSYYSQQTFEIIDSSLFLIPELQDFISIELLLPTSLLTPEVL